MIKITAPAQDERVHILAIEHVVIPPPELLYDTDEEAIEAVLRLGGTAWTRNTDKYAPQVGSDRIAAYDYSDPNVATPIVREALEPTGRVVVFKETIYGTPGTLATRLLYGRWQRWNPCLNVSGVLLRGLLREADADAWCRKLEQQVAEWDADFMRFIHVGPELVPLQTVLKCMPNGHQVPTLSCGEPGYNYMRNPPAALLDWPAFDL